VTTARGNGLLTIDAIMRVAPVIPVLVIDGGVDPAALAAALVDAGLPVIEVTLRTAGALAAIRAMAAVPGVIVGAGTVLDARTMDEAAEAGARFVVSPGLTDAIARAAAAQSMPLLAGVATAGDIMRGLDHGLDRFKFFPAEAAGGIKALNALTAVFGQVRFCPTGGITEASAPDWLAIPSVLCVGGSWVVPKGPADPAAIERTARAAAAL
jgi:2-dehydro-3-deoxyphosphogluconate aldolase/(4S)-4-hydroxy-2-oxoglutarate aldolase